MRKVALFFVALILSVSLPITAQVCRPFTGTVDGVLLDGKGYARYLPTTAKRVSDAPTAGATIPAQAREALVYINTAAIRYRTDGVNPTATEGVLVQPPAVLFFDFFHMSELREFRFIQVSAGAEVTLKYCR